MLLFRRIIPYSMLVLAATTLGLASGCSDDEKPSQTNGAGTSSSSSSSSGSSSSSSGDGGAGGESGFRISGTLEYEYVPYDAANDALDYAGTLKRPIRGASVRLLDADTDTEIAKTLADDKGAYSFDYMGTAKVKLWIYAETEAPSIVVEDNTSGDTVYVMESAVVTSAADAKFDVLAATGWDGSSYAKTRSAAPFAILDAAYTASRRFLDEVTPPPVIPPLKLNWSVNNRPEDGDKSMGLIGTSHFDTEELYILGKEDVDTDEFESHIIVHEWGHFFQGKVGRSDSIGGTHASGDIIDPRVAFGEGFANALSAIILDPDSIYGDSSGPQQGTGFHFDLEANDNSLSASPGWFSETTVQGIIYDLYDGKNEPFDKVNLGMDAIAKAMIADRTTPALTTLFSFVDTIQKNAPEAKTDIDTLLAFYAVDADFGIDPIQDAWATGETHTGGVASAVPLYKDATIGDTYTADLVGVRFNLLAQNRYFRFQGDGMPVMISAQSAGDVAIHVFNVGTIVAEDQNVAGDEFVMFETTAGETYILVVEGYDDQAMSYSATISITH